MDAPTIRRLLEEMREACAKIALPDIADLPSLDVEQERVLIAERIRALPLPDGTEPASDAADAGLGPVTEAELDAARVDLRPRASRCTAIFEMVEKLRLSHHAPTCEKRPLEPRFARTFDPICTCGKEDQDWRVDELKRMIEEIK